MIKTHLTCGSCLALLLALVAIPVSADAFESNSILTVSMESRTFANAENVYDTSSVSRTTESLGYVTDVHGTIYGPEDYAIDGDNIYLLDSGTNTVLVYADNKLVDRYQLDGTVAEHIAVQDGELHTIGTDMKVYHVTKAESRVILDVSPWNEMDSVSDFSIRDDRLYITLPSRDGGKTYIFSIDALQGRIKGTEPTVVTEKTLSDGTTYTVTPILEDDYLLSGLWELELTYLDESVKTIPVHSAHMLAGVEPLTLGEDSFTALISEVDSDEDYQIVYEQSIWELTYEGEILRSQPLPEQYKGVDNAVKVIDDAVYYLRTTEDKMELVQLNEAVLAEERVSRLVEITPIIEEPVASFSLQSTISGDDMIATTELYRRNFSWSCVSFLQWERSFPYIHTYPVCAIPHDPFCWHAPYPFFHNCLQFRD